MSWRVVVRPEIDQDLKEAAEWYDSRQEGLGDRFVAEVFRVFDALAQNPLLRSRKHPHKNVRWRCPDYFPYRVIYKVVKREKLVIIAAVLHAARHDRHWRRRI